MAKTNDNMTDADVMTELEALKDDLLSVKKDLTRVTAAALDQGKQAASQLRDKAADHATQGMSAARECVEERPITTALVAAGVGLLAGVLLSRK